MTHPPGIFISHRRSDANWAGILLESQISQKFPGARVFFDLKSLKAGETWPEGIGDNLQRCHVLIAVIGRTWMTTVDDFDRRRIDDEDDWVRKEISTALERGIPVVPILLDGADMPGGKDRRALPKCLQGIPDQQGRKLRMADYMQDLDRIERELADHLPEEARKRPEIEAAETPPAHAGPSIPLQRVVELLDKASADVDTLQALMVEQSAKKDTALLHAIGRLIEMREREEVDASAEAALVPRFLESQAILDDGNAADAELAFLTLLPEVRKLKGEENNLTLATRHELYRAILNQGRAAEAEREFRNLLAHHEKGLGAEHPDTLITRYNFARAILNQGRAKEAEQAFRDLLSLQENVKGAEHPDTLATRYTLALAILRRGRAAEAEQKFRDLLSLRKGVQGAAHPDTLATHSNLASAILLQGRAAEAEQAFRDLLTLQENVQGAEHPDTLATHSNLASAILHQGRAAEAEQAFRDLLTLHVRVLGAEHPGTLANRHNLALAILFQGRAAEAEQAFRDLLTLHVRVLGAEHPGTLAASLGLARNLLELGKIKGAREIINTIDEITEIPGFRLGQLLTLRAFLNDLSGKAKTAEKHLSEAGRHLDHLSPEHYLRRELDHYRKTRIPGKPGGTTLWARP